MTEYEIERYLNIRNARSPSFGPDGDRLSFLIDTTGVHQVWALEAPQTWPDQMTFEEERVTFAEWSPTRDELVFGMDIGGNERVQFFRLAGDASKTVPLTNRPDAKHLWGGWSPDGNRFAFASNRRDTAVFDVYVQDRAAPPESAELIWKGDGWFTVLDWSPSGDRLLLHEGHSNFDHDIHVLDVSSGEATHLTGDTAAVRYHGVNWAPNGDALYLVTDEGADTLYLARRELDTGELTVLERGGEWNVEGLEMDAESGRFVFVRNVDGYAEPIVAELTGETKFRRLSEPELPTGLVGGIDFGPDGERVAIDATSRTENRNVYVVPADSGAATRWTEAPTAGLPKASFVDPELIRYDTFDDRDIPAFFTHPPETDGETPVIVDIHGGPDSQRRPGFHPIAQYYVGRGFAYFEPNVRGSTGYGRAYTHLDDVRNRMDAVRDLAMGVEWLRDQPTISDDRIVALGGSYGGFMVLAALTEYPDLWAAGVDIVGISNLVTFLENTGEWRRELREAEYGSLAEDREFLTAISPITNIDRIRAPLFVAHGANDPRVPVGEADQIAEAAREQGVPVELLVFEDEGHGFAKLENRIEAYRAIADFLEEHV